MEVAEPGHSLSPIVCRPRTIHACLLFIKTGGAQGLALAHIDDRVAWVCNRIHGTLHNVTIERGAAHDCLPENVIPYLWLELQFTPCALFVTHRV